MNTPEPCNMCVYLYFDTMKEDDPTDEAECKKGLPIGNNNCKEFKNSNA